MLFFFEILTSFSCIISKYLDIYEKSCIFAPPFA